MKALRWSVPFAVASLIATAPLAAVTEVLTGEDVSRAFTIASGSDETRERFHASYVVPFDDPLVERLEIITEFRRLVIAAEEQLKAGNWMMGRGGYDAKGRTLRDLLRPFQGQLSIRARLRFHPQNNYATLPAFDILLGEPTLLATTASRAPHVIPSNDKPGTRDIISGATIEMAWDAVAIDDRTLPVRLFSEGEEIARHSVEFSRLQ